MYYVYILQSINFPDKFYIGYTNDLRRRLMQHNNEHAGHTDKYRPWKIKDYFALDDEQKAKDFEKYLKSQCGREFIKKHFWISSPATTNFLEKHQYLPVFFIRKFSAAA